MKNFAAIEIGGTKLQIILGNEKAQIIERFRFLVDPNAGAEAIRQHIEETFKKIKDRKIAAVGVGFGGPIDRHTGKIWTSYHISGWADFLFKNWLEELTGIPAFVDNDANVAAMGEALYGAGQDFNNVFYVTLGSGVGAGHVVNKEIYHGALPGEMELGHVRLDKTGRTVETSCSGWVVNEKIRNVSRINTDSKLTPIIKRYRGCEAKALNEAMNQGDSHALKIFHETCDDLAFGLSHAVHLLHPEIIVLGGGLSLIGEPLRKLVGQKLTRYLMDAFQPGPVIQLASLKEDVVPIGALALAIQNTKS